MARVPRLNKRILPVLTDPAAIGRIADVSAITGAGALARGVSAIADIGVGFLQERINEQKAEQDALQVLQDQTELTRRASDFQNQAFDIVQTNREAFKNNPKKGVDGLSVALRKFGESFLKGLTPQNVARLKRTQEAAIGRFELQERTNAVTQTRINIQNDINTTAQTYLESSNVAGIAGDFQRLETIVQDVSVLTERAKEVFESKGAIKFSDDLEQGVVENFVDAFMFHNTPDFLDRLNDGTFENLLTEKQISDKKTEAEKLLKTQNEQASFNRSRNFLKNHADLAKRVTTGQIDFNQIDELVAAFDISPEYGEAKRRELINGKIDITTDPIIYANLRAKVERLLETRTITERGKDGTFTVSEKALTTDSMEKALLLIQEIADAQAKGVGLKPSDGNTLTKMLQIGISNTWAREGLTSLESINHYADAIKAFEAQGLEGQELLDATRSYTVLTDTTGVDELNDQLLEVKPFSLSPRANAINLETKENLGGLIERIAKVNRQKVIEDILRKENPSLNVFQGDLPNKLISRGVVTKGLPGGDVKADVSIKIPEATNVFDTIEEMETANLPSGTIVIIGGRKGRID